MRVSFENYTSTFINCEISIPSVAMHSRFIHHRRRMLRMSTYWLTYLLTYWQTTDSTIRTMVRSGYEYWPITATTSVTLPPKKKKKHTHTHTQAQRTMMWAVDRWSRRRCAGHWPGLWYDDHAAGPAMSRRITAAHTTTLHHRADTAAATERPTDPARPWPQPADWPDRARAACHSAPTRPARIPSLPVLPRRGRALPRYIPVSERESSLGRLMPCPAALAVACDVPQCLCFYVCMYRMELITPRV